MLRGCRSPEGGSIIQFSEHLVYITVVSEGYPSEVLTFSSPSVTEDSDCTSSADSRSYAKVLMTGSGGGDTMDSHNTRPTARMTHEVGTSSLFAAASPFDAVLDDLLTPINPATDPAVAAAGMEET